VGIFFELTAIDQSASTQESPARISKEGRREGGEDWILDLGFSVAVSPLRRKGRVDFRFGGAEFWTGRAGEPVLVMMVSEDSATGVAGLTEFAPPEAGGIGSP